MKKNRPYLILLFFLAAYLLFPTGNSTHDGYSYATSIKYAVELFHPHHLLYNITGFLLVQLVNLFGWFPDVLAFMKGINAIAAVLCLWVFYNIIKELGREENESLLLLLLCGSSFSIWRYATENEVYIIPIIFSLLASLYFLRFTKNAKNYNLILSGGFAAIACLYHQIHLFWWLGLLIGIFAYYRKIKFSVFFTLPALIVPIVYLLVIVFEEQQTINYENVVYFIFREFYRGTTDIDFGINNFILSGINTIRSFIQVHGLLFILIKKDLINLLPAIIVILLAIFSLLSKPRIFIKKNGNRDSFVKIQLIVFILHFLFIIYYEGNAEFMVMFPFLVFIILPSYMKIHVKTLTLMVLALFIWNLSYGVLPNYSLNISNNKMIIKHVVENPTDLYVLREEIQIQNEIYYMYGNTAPNIQKPPSILKFKNRSVLEAKERIDSCFREGGKVFTDCLERPKMINRASLTIDSQPDADFFKDYRLTKVDSADTFIGKVYLFEVNN